MKTLADRPRQKIPKCAYCAQRMQRITFTRKKDRVWRKDWACSCAISRRVLGRRRAVL